MKLNKPEKILYSLNIIQFIIGASFFICAYLNTPILKHLVYFWHTEKYLLNKNRVEIKELLSKNNINVDGKMWQNDPKSLFFIKNDKDTYMFISAKNKFVVDRNRLEKSIKNKLTVFGSKNTKEFYNILGSSIEGGFDVFLKYISGDSFEFLSPLTLKKDQQIDSSTYIDLIQIAKASREKTPSIFTMI
ncbi:hypothetical protein A0H76_192 [Hepatospora eriocheir]|uniref:Uncharacterized protein n=1 Tax=Hepatospora eriocheir TaxID=1081669 RepID=A0A1X0QEU1_9MICR|nr:hypothetical protein A0H76_192 [Hepatospora eriocheir]